MHSAILTRDAANNKYMAMYNGHVLAKSGSKEYVVQSIVNGLSAKARQMNVTQIIDKTGNDVVDINHTTQHNKAKIVFNINERFGFLGTLTRMVINGTAPSLLITGPGGYGKTYSVLHEIKEAGLTFTTDFESSTDATNGDDDQEETQNPADVHIVKGFSTAKGLYRTLYENNGRLIIFDDCDSIFRNQDAVNILKGALDSYDERWISWNAEPRVGDSNPLPKKFLFEGRIIFISNLNQSQMDGAIKSRSLRVDLEMTTSEKIDRMYTIVNGGSFMKDANIDFEIQLLAVNFLEKYQDDATELSMRTLISVTKIIVDAQNNGVANWEKLALYTITA